MAGSNDKQDIYHEITGKLPPQLREQPQLLCAVEERVEEYLSQQDKQIYRDNPFADWERILAEYEDQVDNPDLKLLTLEEATAEFSKFAAFARIPPSKEYWSKRIADIKRKQLKEASQLTTDHDNEQNNDTDFLHRELKRENQSYSSESVEDLKKSQLEETSQLTTDHENEQSNDTQLLYSQLMKEWRKRFDNEDQNWELTQIQKLKAAFMQAIEEWLAYLKQVAELIGNLGMELGYFLDFSAGQISLSDIETLKKWLKAIENDQGIKEICKILGRIKQLGHSMEIKLTETSEIENRWLPDNNSKEEIVGIKMSNEIEHLIPAELSLLSSPETAILFDLKFVESRLMCFKMMGYQSVDQIITTTQEEEVEKEEPQGPFILCIDTSGSMHGAPEYVAKAITLYMTNLARKEKRDCYLINFSTQIETLDFSSAMSFPALLGFLQRSFHGGTDLAPALEHALIKMSDGTYSKADLVVVSDFVMPDLPKKLLDKIQNLRTTGSKFHSLCISQDFIPERLRTHFDQEWVFNPHTSSVTELIKFSESV